MKIIINVKGDKIAMFNCFIHPALGITRSVNDVPVDKINGQLKRLFH
jgi:hypothetical protein